MLFRHGVIEGNEIFVVDDFRADAVTRRRVFRFQCRKGNAAAAVRSFPGSENDIAADRADIEDAPLHIGSAVVIFHGFTGQELCHGDVKRLRQRRQKADVGKPPARFP